MTDWQQPDPTNRNVLMANRYRMGDSVAVMELRAWVEKKYGPRDWYYDPDRREMMTTLGRYVDQQWYPTYWEEDGKRTVIAPQSVTELDDVNLWLWNDYFHSIGHRIEFKVPPADAPPILFMPLLEADYATERCLHIRFAVEACVMLKEHGAACVLPPDTNSIDRVLIADTGIPILSKPLHDIIAVIGNTRLFIGCDTGLSHIAGRLPCKQVALYSRGNTERHNETEFDHLYKDRAKIQMMLGDDAPDDPYRPEYRALPNKPGLEEIMFECGGWDGATMERLRETVS